MKRRQVCILPEKRLTMNSLLTCIWVCCSLWSLSQLVLSNPTEPVEVSIDASGDVFDPASHSSTSSNDNPNRTAHQTIEATEEKVPDTARTHVQSAEELPPLPSAPQYANHAVIMTLQKELQEIDTLLELQNKKLVVLEQLRSTLLNEDVLHITNVDYKDLIERKLDDAILTSRKHRRSDEGVFETHFVQRATITTRDQPVQDVAMMKPRPASPLELIALATSNSEVIFYVSPSIQIARMKTSCQAIHAVKLELHAEIPLVMVLCKETSVLVYTIELKYGERLMIGSADGSNSSETEKNPTNVPQIPVYKLTMAELSHIRLPHIPGAVVLTKTVRRSLITIASIDGIISFYAPNGTILHQMITKSTISTMASARNLLAFSNGTNTVVTALTRSREPELHICLGSLAGVSSIAFDPAQFDIVYVGTTHSEILVYSFNPASSSSENNEFTSCRLLSRMLVVKQRQISHPLKLVAIKGYLIVSTPSQVIIYNTTRNQDATVEMHCLGRTQSISHQAPSGRPLPTAVSEGTLFTSLAHVSVDYNGDSTVQLLQSLLPSNADVTNTSWMTILYVFIVFVVVVISQAYFRRQQHASVDNSSHTSRDKLFEKWRHMEQSNDDWDQRFSSEREGNFRSGDTSKYRDRKQYDASSYDLMADDLRRKIEEARKETLECSFDDPEF